MKRTKDHLGNEFSSIREMCNAYGIRQDTFACRMKKGMSLEKALTEKADKVKYQTRDKEGHVTDNEGNVYKSVSELCNAKGINRTTLYNRLSEGMKLQDAITYASKEGTNEKTEAVVDDAGNTFNSIGEMCKYYGVQKEMYIYRKRILNLSTEEALRPKQGNPMHCRDHNGNDYRSVDEMCKAYGVDKDIYKMRRSRGWSLVESLSVGGKTHEQRY